MNTNADSIIVRERFFAGEVVHFLSNRIFIILFQLGEFSVVFSMT